MLELIWTKLSLEFDIDMPWGDDLEIENFNEFLRAQTCYKIRYRRLILNYSVLSKDNLESRKNQKNGNQQK